MEQPNLKYIMTYSGERVGPEFGAPSPESMANALSRIPRFGGHTRVPYSVLEHSLFVEYLSRSYPLLDEKYRPHLRLAALLHDAHEALTGDIPSPFKTPDMKSLQEKIDRRISRAYAPSLSNLFLRAEHRVKSLDRRALLAEALVVGPPGLQTAEQVAYHFGEAPKEEDVATLGFMQFYPQLPKDAIAYFVELVGELSAEIAGA